MQRHVLPRTHAGAMRQAQRARSSSGGSSGSSGTSGGRLQRWLRVVALHRGYAAQPQQAGALHTPEEVVRECLTVLRRGELAALAPWLPEQRLAAPGKPVFVAGVPVHERGPLARAAPLLDTAARRVLPGHLLRRSRILSSVQLGGSCLLRVHVAACTGEETVLLWRLGLVALPGIDSGASTQALQQQPGQQQQQQQEQQQQQQQPHNSNSAAGGAAQSTACRWQLLAVERDASADAEALLSGPHPRASPELVVLSQLRALQAAGAWQPAGPAQAQLMAAAAFNLLGRHASGSAFDAHQAALRRLLEQPHYSVLTQHSGAALGASALPSQRQFLQEVLLQPASPGAPGRPAVHFVWRLGMHAEGCWLVRSFERLEDAT